MSNFTPSITEVFEFDGDTVKVTFNGLKRKHIITLSPYMSEDANTISFQDQVKFAEAAATFMPEIITKIEGLNDADGNPIPLETMLSETYFTRLVSDIMTSILTHSFLKGEETGN